MSHLLPPWAHSSRKLEPRHWHKVRAPREAPATYFHAEELQSGWVRQTSSCFTGTVTHTGHGGGTGMDGHTANLAQLEWNLRLLIDG